jgi:hypothetical protein
MHRFSADLAHWNATALMAIFFQAARNLNRLILHGRADGSNFPSPFSEVFGVFVFAAKCLLSVADTNSSIRMGTTMHAIKIFDDDVAAFSEVLRETVSVRYWHHSCTLIVAIPLVDS